MIFGRRFAGWCLGFGLLVLAGPAPAKTQATVRVTSGVHPGYGRVVLDAPGLTHTVTRDGSHVVIRFADDPPVGALPAAPRNVLAMVAVPGGVELTVPPDAEMHETQIGSRVVIDIDDVTPAPPREDRKNKPERVAARPEIAHPEAGPVAVVKGDAKPEIAHPAAGPVAVVKGDAKPEIAHPAAGPGAVVKGDTKPEIAHPAVVPGAVVKGAANAAESTRPPANAPPPLVSGVREQSKSDSAADHETVPAQVARVEPAAPRIAPAGEQAPREKPGEEQQAETDASESPRDTAKSDTADARPDEISALHVPLSLAPLSLTPLDATQVWPVTRDAVPSGPVALVATRARPLAGLTGVALQVPFADPVGAALFSRGSETYVVFDERRPIDLAALRDDPVFGSAVVTIYPAATVIRLIIPQGQSAVLARAPSGWRVSVGPGTPRPSALTPVAAAGAITFAAEAPGQVVAISDPTTGGTLLAGTQRKPGQAILVERRTAEFTLPVTGQGIVIDPLSDTITLRITPAGFVLEGQPSGLAQSPPAPMAEAMGEAARLTRRFEFPGQPTATLLRREKQEGVEAAVAPPRTRGPKRHKLAESMLALGLGAEAQSLLRATMKDDPREAASPDTIGLTAIAALLAGRPAESGDLGDPRLTGTDEIALWRAIQTAMTDDGSPGGSPGAALVFATTAPLLFAYPGELRRRVLPLVLETMILGGQAEPASRLLAQRAHDPRLAYARALLKQAQGDNEDALKLYDEMAKTRSPLDHARAAVRAVELRLLMGQLDTKGAADALDSLLYAWRGDDRDLALRRRLAELREKEGAWRTTFALLRGAKADFPGHAAEIDRQLKEAFVALPRDPSIATMAPAELIALLEENTELLPDGPDGEPMRIQLAEKLMALDLPKRADPLLTKLMRAAPIGPARAGFGATLATVRLHEGDGDGALVALSESNSADMQDAVRERRALLIARVQAKRGDIGGAVEALSGLGTREADETRASLLEQAHDWPAARDALTTLTARVIPGAGVLDDEQRRIVLRLATASAHAGDDSGLASLRERMGSRIGTGPVADMFRLLTEQPVRGTADLARARAEMGLARAITADTGARKPATRTP
jgi:hypothetical protein